MIWKSKCYMLNSPPRTNQQLEDVEKESCCIWNQVKQDTAAVSMEQTDVTTEKAAVWQAF